VRRRRTRGLARRLLPEERVKRALFSLFLLLPLLSRASDAVLDEINLARTRPALYAHIVAERMESLPGADSRCAAEAEAFLMRQRPLEPLQSAAGLVSSARRLVDDQADSGGVGHRGADGSSPMSRMARCGQWTGPVGENISYGYDDARTIVVTLIVDQGVLSRSHRRNIFSSDFKLAGAARGPHARFGEMCVIDFAGGLGEKGDKLVMTEFWQGVGE
jgi:hypothetical protein